MGWEEIQRSCFTRHSVPPVLTNHPCPTQRSPSRSRSRSLALTLSQSDCLVFDTGIAQLFADNGNLGINVTISRVVI